MLFAGPRLSDRSHSGGHFPFIFAAVINIPPAHCRASATGGPRGFRFQNPLEAISSFITISHSLPLALGMHVARACSPRSDLGGGGKQGRLPDEDPDLLNLPPASDQPDARLFFFFVITRLLITVDDPQLKTR